MRELHPPEGLAGEPEAVVRPCFVCLRFLERTIARVDGVRQRLKCGRAAECALACSKTLANSYSCGVRMRTTRTEAHGAA